MLRRILLEEASEERPERSSGERPEGSSGVMVAFGKLGSVVLLGGEKTSYVRKK